MIISFMVVNFPKYKLVNIVIVDISEYFCQYSERIGFLFNNDFKVHDKLCLFSISLSKFIGGYSLFMQDNMKTV